MRVTADCFTYSTCFTTPHTFTVSPSFTFTCFVPVFFVNDTYCVKHHPPGPQCCSRVWRRAWWGTGGWPVAAPCAVPPPADAGLSCCRWRTMGDPAAPPPPSSPFLGPATSHQCTLVKGFSVTRAWNCERQNPGGFIPFPSKVFSTHTDIVKTEGFSPWEIQLASTWVKQGICRKSLVTERSNCTEKQQSCPEK